MLSTTGWLWTWNYPAMASCFTEYKQEGKQSPNSLNHHHNEKKNYEYFWCATKDNWASQISEVALRKELEKWKPNFHHQA